MTKEQNKSTERFLAVPPPDWEPSGKTQWMLQLMLGVLRGGISDQRAAGYHLRDVYINTLSAAAYYLSEIEGEECWDSRLSDVFDHLAHALTDLRLGVVDPLLEPEGGGKRDSIYCWKARMGVVFALEYFHGSGQAYAQTAKMAAAKFPELENLKRGERRGLPSSILSWRIQFLDGKVPIPALRREFKEQYEYWFVPRTRIESEQGEDELKRAIRIESYRQRGEDELERAAELARRLIQPK